MEDKHPHDGATYTILRLDDGTFGVEVTIPGANPVVVTGLDGEAGAEKWIARHRETVADGASKKLVAVRAASLRKGPHPRIKSEGRP